MGLPLSIAAAVKCSKWMKMHFGEQINEYILNTPYSQELVISIALQETAQKWVLWIDKYSPEVILQRCVFDASGNDFPGTHRNAFPRTKVEFQQLYGLSATDMLVHEANLTRAMPQPGDPNGYGPASYLYKGYGIFQYDLQNIKTDPDFFLQKEWYSFSACLYRLISVLNEKAGRTDNLKGIVKAYNGGGQKADEYANNVFDFMDIV